MTRLLFSLLRVCLICMVGGYWSLFARESQELGANAQKKSDPRQNHTSPLLSDKAFFTALNLDYPGLEQVRSLVRAEDIAAAKTAFAQYLRTRRHVHWFYDWRQPTRLLSYNQMEADRCIAGHFAFAGYDRHFPHGDIDWHDTPSPTSQWVTLLNRMDFWHDIGQTYWGTADPRYTTAWVKQLRSWIAQNPRPDSAQSILHPWATIDVAERMKSSWPDSFFRHISSPAFSDANVILFVKSCIEQGRHLRRFHSGPGILNTNINAWEFSGLYTVGCVFPECREASEWRHFAAEKMRDQEYYQFYPDGAHIELSPRYHIGTIDSILSLYKIAALNGRQAELPADFLGRMEKAYEFLLYQTAPTGLLPPYNDCGAANEDSYALLAEGVALFPHRRDFLWPHGKGTPPPHTSYFFPYAGYAAMRSDWQRTANYLNFDTGPLGSSRHRHDDSLNLTLWAWGREMLFDNGGGSYEATIWRTWGTSSYSHNCITVDGLDMEGGSKKNAPTHADFFSQGPRQARWESTPPYDFAAGIYNRGYGDDYDHRPASQQRRVLFVKPDLFIVADTMTPNDALPHSYQARWHLLTTQTQLHAATQTISSCDADVANLAIVPLQQQGLRAERFSGQLAAKQGRQPVLAQMMGWDLPHLSQGAQTPATTVTHNLSGVGVKQFLTLLIPLKPGHGQPVVRIQHTGNNAATVWLEDGRQLEIDADPDPAKGIRCTETLANGTVGRRVAAGAPGLSQLRLSPPSTAHSGLVDSTPRQRAALSWRSAPLHFHHRSP